MVEKSLILIKPDGVRRGLIGEVISRFERRGFTIVDMKMLTVSSELADAHYQEHIDKPFYPGLKSYITSGPIIAFVIQGESAVRVTRQMVGATDPADAAPGTIRGTYALIKSENIIHASDSVESAAREISLYF